jgi:hypothetical protein
VTKQTDNSLTLEIPVLADGASIKARLQAALTTELGPDRAGFFMDRPNFDYVDDFYNFGQEKRDITITQKNGEDGNPEYILKEGQNYQKFSTLPPPYDKFVDLTPTGT